MLAPNHNETIPMADLSVNSGPVTTRSSKHVYGVMVISREAMMVGSVIPLTNLGLLLQGSFQ